MITTKFIHRPCPVCNSEVHGRIDKRYCSLKCKNAHHYVSRRMNKPMGMMIFNKIMRNRTILEGIMQGKPNKLRISQIALIHHGFCFETITGVSGGFNKPIYRCLQFSYSVDQGGMVTVTRHVEIEIVYPGFYERWAIDFPDLEVVKSANTGQNGVVPPTNSA